MEIDGNKLPLVVRGQEELKESLIAYACCWRRKAVVGGGRDDMVPEVWQRIAEFLMWQKETDPWVEAWSANAMSPVKSPAWALSTSVMARLPTVDDGNWMAFYLASDNYVEQSVETWPHLRQRLLSPPLLYDYAAFIERLDALVWHHGSSIGRIIFSFNTATASLFSIDFVFKPRTSAKLTSEDEYLFVVHGQSASVVSDSSAYGEEMAAVLQST
ncbi:hypothetical protein DIPPA_04394 [Diplonema papillatum]|nr:hypothetical protein DIPPA_04394 [Diplonema papillatum]